MSDGHLSLSDVAIISLYAGIQSIAGLQLTIKIFICFHHRAIQDPISFFVLPAIFELSWLTVVVGIMISWSGLI